MKGIKGIIVMLFIGIAVGNLIFTLLSIINLSLGYETYISDFMVNYVKYSIIAMIIGVGFSLPSIIYIREDLSVPLKVLIHMGIGMTIYVLAALYAGWIPKSVSIEAIITLILGFTIAWLILFGFILYNRKEAIKINNEIKKRN